ncbi:threonine ammonia-lyase [Ottowia thiooxydans]|uniref:Threonine dehydratase n=1 Tax=Ottowia thiooxydans TaxID=219182 RepID=A0ABV2Q362_9BURK
MKIPESPIDLTLDQIRATASRISKWVDKTPVVRFQGMLVDREPWLANVWLKLELFQKTGTFKSRGAVNTVLELDREQIQRGITAMSAGNHAVAAAYAAKAAGASAKIVVQASANPIRIEAARAYGAEIVMAPDGKSGFAAAEMLVKNEGRFFVHPFEGRTVSLGTATLGLELTEQLPDLDAVVVSIGGGGLASGVAAAIKLVNPRCKVYGVEPEGAAAMSRSFELKRPTTLDAVNTIADSLAPPMTLPFSFSLCYKNVDEIATVTDDEICRAMYILFRDAKLTVEPAGAAALAAILGPLKGALNGKKVASIVCGANIDHSTFFRLIERGEKLAR